MRIEQETIPQGVSVRACAPSRCSQVRRGLGLFVAVLVMLVPATGRGGEPTETPLVEGKTDRAESTPTPSAKKPGTIEKMEFRDTDLATVLRTICKGAGVDFVLEPKVKGTVTAKLQKTSWEDALETILKSQGLAADRKGNTLFIFRDEPNKANAAKKLITVKPRPDKTFDFDARGADIHVALRELAVATGMNIVGSKNVSGTVTMGLRGLRAEEILGALADSVGAAITEKGTLTLLVPQAVETTPTENAGTATSDTTPTATNRTQQSSVKIESLKDGLFSVHATEADIRDVISRLAAASKLNIITSSGISRTATIDLKGVSATDAITAIAAQSGLSVRRPVEGVLLVAPPAILMETFRLCNANVAEASKAITDSIDGIKVAVEPGNNMLIITGPRKLVADARKIIEQVEKPRVQVTIEALILETNITAEQRLGVDWSDKIGVDLTTPEIPHTWPLDSGTSTKLHPGYDPSDVRSRGDKIVPFDSTDNFKFGFLTSTGLSMVFHMLKEDTTTSMVANPTITTVENQEASINIVTKYPVAQYQVSSETGVLSVSGFEYKEFGTILTVTPRVTDGHIILKVHPEISRQAGTTAFQGAELPVIQSQETQTEVRIKDGETLVIAGLVRESSEKSKNGVPFLSSIPLLGRLFSSKRDKLDEKRDLMIFITPHIVNEKDFVRSAALQAERQQQMSNTKETDEKTEDETKDEH